MADDDEERRHLSPDSSTQVLQREKHKHKRKKKHKHKSKKRKRKHSDVDEKSEEEQHSVSSHGSSGHSDDDKQECTDGENELALDIKPLTEYVDDRKELNNELFKIMGRKQMKKLLPKSIKKMDVEELKSRCLDQLEGISKRRLLKLIDGREMSSSSSESERENDSRSSIAKKSSKQNARVTPSKLPTAIPDVKENPVNILEELSLVPDQEEIDELIEGAPENLEPTVDVESSESPKAIVVDTESQLLELEYRARALKSMVKAQQSLKT